MISRWCNSVGDSSTLTLFEEMGSVRNCPFIADTGHQVSLYVDRVFTEWSYSHSLECGIFACGIYCIPPELYGIFCFEIKRNSAEMNAIPHRLTEWTELKKPWEIPYRRNPLITPPIYQCSGSRS